MSKLNNALFLFTLIFLIANHADGQRITSKNGLYGLVNQNGKVILHNECDTIFNLTIDFKGVPVFVYRKNNKFGIYNNSKSHLTGLVYDEVVCDPQGYYFLRKGNLWGFVTESYNYKFDIVQPQYDDLLPMGRGVNPYKPFDRKSYLDSKNIRVKSDGLYGLASYETGELIIPIKYIGAIEMRTAYNSKDYYEILVRQGNGACIIINDSTNIDFKFSYHSDIFIPFSDTLLFAVNELEADQKRLEIWSYYTGMLLFEFTRSCEYEQNAFYDLTYKRLNDHIIEIVEETASHDDPERHSKRVYCFDIFTGQCLFDSKKGEFTSMDLRYDKNWRKAWYVCNNRNQGNKRKWILVGYPIGDSDEIEFVSNQEIN